MKTILTIALFALPLPALADYMDVIEFKLKEGCEFSEYLEIVADFNEQWGSKHAYRSEIAMPVQSNNLETLFWVGRTANAAAFGAAWDAWRDEITDADSLAGKLSARFAKCSENVGRRGYDTY
ncbi:MAG: hypothetical protein ACR2QV_09435 [Gammaproteobacteria bacterium]